jgi:hypothetical protein
VAAVDRSESSHAPHHVKAPPKSAALLAGCVLARPQPAGCAWCGTALPARRRTWCSDRCATTFWTNHWWTLARRAAKRRDKYRCRACGAAAPKRPTRAACTTAAAYRTAMRVWRTAKKTERMEVNHRVPCRGKHGALSCDHHLVNLETLCVACHRRLTETDRKTLAKGRLTLTDAPAAPRRPRATKAVSRA